MTMMQWGVPSSSSSRFQLLRRRKDPTSLSSSYSTAAPSPRKLDDILKLESLRGKTREEIALIWTEVRRRGEGEKREREKREREREREKRGRGRGRKEREGEREGEGEGGGRERAPFSVFRFCASLSIFQKKIPNHQFHRDDSKNRVGGTLSAAAYKDFKEHVAEAPMLVWPLRKEAAEAAGSGSGEGEGGKRGGEGAGQGPAPGGGGLVVLLSQAQLPHVLFTTVDEFRALGPDAPAHVVLTHYTELAEEKGVVLWRADVVSPALLVSASLGSRSPPSCSSAAAAAAAAAEGEGEAKASPAPPPSTSSSDTARALVATTHALYADPEGRAHARAFNEAKGFDFGALLRYLGLAA